MMHFPKTISVRILFVDSLEFLYFMGVYSSDSPRLYLDTLFIYYDLFFHRIFEETRDIIVDTVGELGAGTIFFNVSEYIHR